MARSFLTAEVSAWLHCTTGAYKRTNIRGYYLQKSSMISLFIMYKSPQHGGSARAHAVVP